MITFIFAYGSIFHFFSKWSVKRNRFDQGLRITKFYSPLNDNLMRSFSGSWDSQYLFYSISMIMRHSDVVSFGSSSFSYFFFDLFPQILDRDSIRHHPTLHQVPPSDTLLPSLMMKMIHVNPRMHLPAISPRFPCDQHPGHQNTTSKHDGSFKMVSSQRGEADKVLLTHSLPDVAAIVLHLWNERTQQSQD